MSTDDHILWTDAERRLLGAVLDQIIPANADKDIPSAGSPQTIAYLSGIAAADPAVAQMFRQGLALADALAHRVGSEFNQLAIDQKVALLGQLETAEPVFFETLLRHTYMGYYSRPDIRAVLGLSPKPTQPDGYDVPRESPEFMAELTEPVVTRGQVYRPC